MPSRRSRAKKLCGPPRRRETLAEILVRLATSLRPVRKGKRRGWPTAAALHRAMAADARCSKTNNPLWEVSLRRIQQVVRSLDWKPLPLTPNEAARPPRHSYFVSQY